MATARVALVGCRRVGGGPPGDLYPNPDAGPILTTLTEQDATGHLVAWDDPVVAWDGFDRALVSGTWDSVDHPDEYLTWSRSVAAVTVLINDPVVLAWGLDKHYLQVLDAAGIPVVPTTWVEPGQSWQLPADTELVVKPAVSGGGRDTARYAPGDGRAVAHVERLQRAGRAVLVQEYVQGIDRYGETDLVYLGGAFSHSVKKRPGLALGEEPGERPRERMAWDGLVTPAADQLALGAAALAATIARVGCVPAYARVDLVDAGIGSPQILEVELVDPYLSLDLLPSATEHLVAATLGEAPAGGRGTRRRPRPD